MISEACSIIATHKYIYQYPMYCSSEIFNKKYFIDEKIQGKIFLWIHDFLEIFLPSTYIGNDNSTSLMLPRWSDRLWQTIILIATTL